MAKDFSEDFYKSGAWTRCRDAYKKSVNGLCEECLAEGKITPGEIVHHVVELNPRNIHDSSISLSWDNLRLLCREHHAAAHGARQKRWTVGTGGRVEIK